MKAYSPLKFLNNKNSSSVLKVIFLPQWKRECFHHENSNLVLLRWDTRLLSMQKKARAEDDNFEDDYSPQYHHTTCVVKQRDNDHVILSREFSSCLA